MTMSRPISKELFKRMILKQMAKEKKSVSIEWMLKNSFLAFWEIDPLSNDEFAEAYRATTELDRDGFLTQDPTQLPQRILVLTAQGRKAASAELEKMRLPFLNIDQMLSRDDLRSKVRDDFNSGDYEIAIFKAFRHLEESVRDRAAQPASSLGVNLMTAAFKVSGGLLKHPEAAVDPEAEALHQLMRGSIGWFKNPSSHRTVGYSDEHRAAHVLGFANLLLDLLDECGQQPVKP